MFCPQGFHLRPAKRFAEAMRGFSADIYLSCNENRVNGKSMLQLMSACLTSGSEITLECSGNDELEMLITAKAFLQNGCGEV